MVALSVLCAYGVPISLKVQGVYQFATRAPELLTFNIRLRFIVDRHYQMSLLIICLK